MAVRNCWDEGTILPCVGREHTNSPSPMAADGWTMMASAFAHHQRCGRDHRRVIDIGEGGMGGNDTITGNGNSLWSPHLHNLGAKSPNVSKGP
jgi:hypothetical protein